LAAAIGGAGSTVLLAGEAGLGKSALLRRFLDRAGADVRIVHGECTEIDARRPFGPFVDAFVAAGIAVPAELGQGGPGAQSVAEAERYRVHHAFASAIQSLAATAPVVVAIDDLHWGDEATFELFPYLARKIG